MQSRRVFLGSTAALGVVGVATSVFRASAQDHTHATADPVLDELRQQMIAAVGALQAGNNGGEPARRIAGVLRVASAAGVPQRFDARLRAAVRREGRDAMLLRPVDPNAFAGEIEQFGIDVPAPRLPGYAESAAALDRLLKDGLVSVFADASASFVKMGAQLDRRRGSALQVAFFEDTCADADSALLAIETMMIIACLFAEFDFGISCFFLSGMYIGMRLSFCLQGCC